MDGNFFRGLEACGHGRALGAAALTVVCLPHCKPSGNDVVRADLLLGQALRVLEGLECLSLRGWQCIDDLRLAKLVSLLLDAAPRLEALDLSDCGAALHTLRVLAGPSASTVSSGGDSTKSSLRSALGMSLLPGPCLAHLSLEGCPLGQLAAVSGSNAGSSSGGNDASSRAAVAEAVQLVGTLVAARGPEALSLRKCWALGQHSPFASPLPARSKEQHHRGSGHDSTGLSSVLELLQQASGAAANGANEAVGVAVAAAAGGGGTVAAADAVSDDLSAPRAVPPLVASQGWAALQSLEVVVPMVTAAQGSPLTALALDERGRSTAAAAFADDAGLFGNFSLGAHGSNTIATPSIVSPDRLSYSDLLAVGMSPPEAQAVLEAAQQDHTVGFGDAFGGVSPGGSLSFPGGNPSSKVAARARGDSDVGDGVAHTGADLARLHPGLALSLETELTDFLEVD